MYYYFYFFSLKRKICVFYIARLINLSSIIIIAINNLIFAFSNHKNGISKTKKILKLNGFQFVII